MKPLETTSNKPGIVPTPILPRIPGKWEKPTDKECKFPQKSLIWGLFVPPHFFFAPKTTGSKPASLRSSVIWNIDVPDVKHSNDKIKFCDTLEKFPGLRAAPEAEMIRFDALDDLI